MRVSRSRVLQRRTILPRLSHTAVDGVDEDIIRVSSRMPHRKAEQTLRLDKLAFGIKARRIVVRDHHFLRRIIHKRLHPHKKINIQHFKKQKKKTKKHRKKTHSLRALIKEVAHARRRISRPVRIEISALDHAEKVENARIARRDDAADVWCARDDVVLVAARVGGGVCRVRVDVASRQGYAGFDGPRVAVSRDGE